MTLTIRRFDSDDGFAGSGGAPPDDPPVVGGGAARLSWGRTRVEYSQGGDEIGFGPFTYTPDVGGGIALGGAAAITFVGTSTIDEGINYQPPRMRIDPRRIRQPRDYPNDELGLAFIVDDTPDVTPPRPWLITRLVPTDFTEDVLRFGPASFSHVASGGIALGGHSPAKQEYAPTTSGGVALGGTAPSIVRRAVVAIGGIALGGAASAVRRYASTTAGGISLGGQAGVSFSTGGGATYQFNATGGITLGGAGVIVTSRQVAAAGGISLGGAALTATGKAYAVVAVGGIQLGGRAGASVTRLHRAQGGILLGGAAHAARFNGFVPAEWRLHLTPDDHRRHLTPDIWRRHLTPD